MKSDEEIKTDIYRYILGSELCNNINGGLYKSKRPHNSTSEDIVISVIANMNGQIQEASVNVNIYVADILVNNQPEEDTIRLTELCRLAIELFDVFRGDDFRATLQSQSVVEVNGASEHVINNRISYKQVNE